MSSTTANPPETAPDATQHRVRNFRLLGGDRGWRTALREFLVIVTGVLSALAAQAWWERGQERERERAYLYQLLADTRENERRIALAMREDSASMHAVGRVVRALHTPGPMPSNDSLATWLLIALNSSDFQPVTGTYQALLSAGDLRLLHNDTLRGLVVGYAATLAHERDMLMLFLQGVLNTASPLAQAVPFIRRIFIDDPPRAGAYGFDFAARRNDPEMGAALFVLQVANRNRFNHLRRLLEKTVELRRALEAEPGLN
ncbi:MAG: hypothetical protein ACRENP_19930 [Longimicrobiales bacterium]